MPQKVQGIFLGQIGCRYLFFPFATSVGIVAHIVRLLVFGSRRLPMVAFKETGPLLYGLLLLLERENKKNENMERAQR